MQNMRWRTWETMFWLQENENGETGPGLRAACSPHSRGKQRRLARQAAHARTRGTIAARASGARAAPSREAGRARPGWGGGWLPSEREVALSLPAPLPLFHGGRMLQLASVMRETTTGSRHKRWKTVLKIVENGETGTQKNSEEVANGTGMG